MPSLDTLKTTGDDIVLLQSRWGWLLAAGIALAAVGALALGNVLLATVASIFFVGTMMLIAGIAQIAYAFQVKGWGQFAIWLLIGALYIAAGLLAFSNPLLASSMLTLLFAISIMAAGIFRVVAGFGLRPSEGWGWLLAGGVLAIVVGGIVLSGWPVNSLWLIGALLAFDLLFHGLALAVIALALRRSRPTPTRR